MRPVMPEVDIPPDNTIVPCEQCYCAAPDGSERCGDCLACKIWPDGCETCNPALSYDLGGEG